MTLSWDSSLLAKGAVALVGALTFACGSEAPGQDPGQPYVKSMEGVGAGGSGGGVDAVLYPAGPYGYTVGSVVPNVRFLGWRDPMGSGYDVAKLEEMSFADLYDPDGSKGYDIILANSSAAWCGPCQAEYQTLDSHFTELAPRGLVILGTLFEDGQSNPADPQALEIWSKQFGVNFPMALDPGYRMGTFFQASVFPTNVLISPRDMRLVDVIIGNRESLWTDIQTKIDAE
jgi:hypothetical protein